jgi:hypothetical protein
MSATVQNKTVEADDKHSVDAELTAEFDGMWFASEFEEGDDLALTVGSEQGHATVWSVEPADGVMILDLSAFDRQDDLVTFADHSTTGPDFISHDFGFSLDAVPVDSRAAEHDAETTHVVCECGTVCKEGRGHSIHCAAHSDNETEETADEGSDEELPHPRDDPDIKYCHEGKRYDVAGSDTTFEIVTFDPGTLPELDGLVVIETVDGSPINSEHQHRKGGVSRKVLGEHTSDDADRAVWTATGLLSCIRRLEILEDDVGSYRDYYWERQD